MPVECGAEEIVDVAHEVDVDVGSKEAAFELLFDGVVWAEIDEIIHVRSILRRWEDGRSGRSCPVKMQGALGQGDRPMSRRKGRGVATGTVDGGVVTEVV